MGSGTSRGKKVAPARVSEVKVTQTADGVASPGQHDRTFEPLKIGSALRSRRAPPDCHSAGHDSEFSGEDDDADGQLVAVVAGYEERAKRAKKTPAKKTFVRSRTYGLCSFRRGETDEERGPAPPMSAAAPAEQPRGPRAAPRDVNKRISDAFAHSRKHTPPSTGQLNSASSDSLARGASLEAVPTSEKQSTFGSCHSSSLAMPVILYDGSEEELMDTIEREFS